MFSLLLYTSFKSLRKAISMASLSLDSPLSPSLPSPLSWVSKHFLGQGEGSLVSDDLETRKICQEDDVSEEAQVSEMERKGLHERKSRDEDYSGDGMIFQEEKMMQENLHWGGFQKGLHDHYSQQNSGFSINRRLDSSGIAKVGVDKKATKLKKTRPPKLVVPEYCPKMEFGEMKRKLENKEFEVQGRDFCLASKKGRRDVMEDGYGVMIDILGDTKQAFFAVIDGHGGRAAADYVAENLGKNIVKALEETTENLPVKREQEAIRRGYLLTDKEFLNQGVSSGACAASVFLKDGEAHVANVGDCGVVLSRKGEADTLTIDHRVNRENERLRIENSGGFVCLRNGIWRVQGSLAISRAIGDLHLKEWIISEPEIKRFPLTADCEFLIMASDGLWDKVDEQEAVDVVLRERNSMESCKKLIDLSFSRGNMDDITVMVINLQNFVTKGR